MVSEIFVINMPNSEIQDELMNEVMILEMTLEYAKRSEQKQKNIKTIRGNGRYGHSFSRDGKFGQGNSGSRRGNPCNSCGNLWSMKHRQVCPTMGHGCRKGGMKNLLPECVGVKARKANLVRGSSIGGIGTRPSVYHEDEKKN